MAKTLLVGNFGAGNIGDEMILFTALQKYPQSVVMTANAQWTKAFLGRPDLETLERPAGGIRSAFRGRTSQRFFGDSYREVERVVFPGGGLFAILFEACFLWSLIIFSLKRRLPHTPFLFEAQGVDQNLGLLSRWLTKWSLAQGQSLSVRDADSLQAVLNLGLRHPSLVQDPVLEYFTHFDKSALSEKEKNHPILLLNAVKPFDQEIYSRIKKEFNNYKVKYVCMEEKDQENIPKNFEDEVVYPQTKDEVVQLFTSAEWAIGERLHFLILASTLTGKPNTRLLREPYSEKVTSFAQNQGINRF